MIWIIFFWLSWCAEIFFYILLLLFFKETLFIIVTVTYSISIHINCFNWPKTTLWKYKKRVISNKICNCQKHFFNKSDQILADTQFRILNWINIWIRFSERCWKETDWKCEYVEGEWLLHQRYIGKSMKIWMIILTWGIYLKGLNKSTSYLICNSQNLLPLL